MSNKKNNNTNHSSIPWVEKYRPTSFESIVLDKTNKTLLENMIEHHFMPNLLLYGPPGTGKTTTIINTIKLYQETKKEFGKELVIHLNASDERGIDTIRNQIYQFVQGKTLFGKGTKFVILDEVDYMTQNAQIALKQLINEHRFNENVKFCLVCNYISKIEISLRECFVCLRFNHLPKDKILHFLKNIYTCEKHNITLENLKHIQKYFGSDIRSMINFLQINKNMHSNKNKTKKELSKLNVLNNKTLFGYLGYIKDSK